MYLVNCHRNCSWEDANISAIAAGGYLATIGSGAENSFVFSLVDSPEYWLTGWWGDSLGPWLGGLKTNNVWTWVTGEPFNYTNWSRGEPNNAAPYEDRLEFFINSIGRGAYWNDYSDARALNYAFPNGYVIEYNSLPSTAPVPDPGTLWLLGSGLIGLMGLKKKYVR